MGAEFLAALAGLAWVASGAILATLLARRAVRRWFGAALAYQLWLIVPASMIASLISSLPSHRQVLVAPMLQLATYTEPVFARTEPGWTGWMLLAWTCGAVLVAIHFWRGHRLFLRSLGRLTEREGIFFAASAQCGPASVGLWRPRVIVPSDFKERYSAAEQMLIIAHERMHILRRDAYANALQALLQCLFWFNPLVLFAAGRFRFDQELACDAAVLRRQPCQRRSYAEAMLKTQTAFTVASGPITNHWQSSHPLKERILTLHQTPPSAARRRAGRILVATLACAGAYSALAARAGTAAVADAKTYLVAMTLTTPAGKSSPRLKVRASENFKVVTSDDSGARFTASLALTAVGSDSVKLQGTVECGKPGAAPLAARPELAVITRLGEAATVKLEDAGGNCELALVISDAGPVIAN
jgi:bla regulator protein BlaR1